MNEHASKRRVISPDELRSLTENLNPGEYFPLTVTGHSMLPFLHPGRDTVYLSRFNGNAAKGDILMFDAGGRLLLHRVKCVTPDGIIFLGDAHTQCEGPFSQGSVTAACNFVNRNGKKLGADSFVWLFFSKIWINIVPLRKPVLSLYNILKYRDNRRDK